jgi:hypothetical protein
MFIPSGDNDPGHQSILVFIHNLLEQGRGGVDGGRGAVLDPVELEMVVDYISDCLRIGG